MQRRDALANTQTAALSPGRVIRRIADGDLYYALGRFRTVRRGYTAWQALRQSVAPPAARADGETIFGAYDAAAVVAALRRDAIFPGLHLPAGYVEQLRAFAQTAPLKRWEYNESFTYDQVKDGRLPSGEPVVVGSVHDPLACALVGRIADDPQLRRVVSAYMGYVPRQTKTVLFWNFASNLSAEERQRLHQATQFHYDVDGYNFLYVQFFLTDVDLESGPHIVIKGSHRRKPMRLLLSSVKQTDEAIYARYGRDSEEIITGPAGFGFIEDTTCFHKGLAPISRDRLLLQFVFM